MRDYIVTGATGYVGYVLVQKMVEEGYKPIKIIVRSEKSLERFKGLPIKGVIGDVLDRDFINREITPGSAVFHLAGIIDIGTAKHKDIYRVNVEGCKNVVDACIKNGAERLVYTSSVSVIKPPNKGSKITEPAEISVKGLPGHYAKSKALATQYIIRKCREGLDAVIAYPSAIIGPFDNNISNLGQVVLDYINHELTAYIKGGYNFVDVRDVADGLLGCYEAGKSGMGYIIGGESITLDEMFKILNEKLGRTKLPFKLPLLFVKIFLPLAELYYLIRRKKPIFSTCSLKILQQNCNFDTTRAKEELNFKSKSTKESFNDMIDWFFANKKELIKSKFL